MNQHAQFIRRVQQFATRKVGCDIGDRVASEGSTHAPVMIVGFQHGDGESHPFSGGHGLFLRETMGQMKVPGQYCFLTNIVKAPAPVLGLGSDRTKDWLAFFREEVQLVNPRCVILCGPLAAAAGLDQPQADFDQLRRVRFVRTDSIGVSYFVTHSPYDIPQPAAGLDARGLEFVQDLRAVFEADANYFERIRPIRV